MNEILTTLYDHRFAVGGVLWYIFSSIIVSLPAKDVPFVFYGWFFDFTHQILNLKPIAGLSAPLPAGSVQVTDVHRVTAVPEAQPSDSLKSIAVLVVFAAFLLFSGCKVAGVAGQPTAPVIGYPQAATLMNSLAQDVARAQQIEITLHNGGQIDNATHVAIQKAFLAVDTIGPQIDSAILAQSNSVTIRTKIYAAMDSLTGITLATGKLDSAATQQLTNAVSIIKILLGNVLDALPNPISQVTHGPTHNRSVGGAGYLARATSLQAGRGFWDRSRTPSRGDSCAGGRQLCSRSASRTERNHQVRVAA